MADRCAEILRAVDRLTRRTGRPPTVREIAEAVGLSSTSTVQQYIEQLIRRGELIRTKGTTRSLRRPRRLPSAGVAQDHPVDELLDELVAWVGLQEAGIRRSSENDATDGALNAFRALRGWIENRRRSLVMERSNHGAGPG